MNTFFEHIDVSSRGPVEFIDITKQTAEIVRSSGVRNGVVTVFTRHTTGAIKINENCGRLQKDMAAVLEKVVPRGEGYMHDHAAIDGRSNGHSHLKALFLNASEHIPLKNGELLLGNWQSIFFVELDGPRAERQIVVSVVGI